MINMKKKTNNKFNFISYLFIILIIAIICSYYLIKYINKKSYPYLYNYATSEVKKISQQLLNNAITEEIEKELKSENLYEIAKNNNEEITLINFNAKEVNSIMTKITKNIESEIAATENIKNIPKEIIFLQKENALIYQIPISTATQNIFLSNLGTKIPIKLSLISNVNSKIETEVKEYGLNNALLKIEVKVIITSKIITPLITEEIIVDNYYPISLKIIQSPLPNYYINGLNN